MAKNLARIICTEEDKVNCPFYFKTGACRYGDRCTKRHLKPSISQTLLFKNMYQNPPIAIAMAEGHQVPDAEMMQAIQEFHSFYSEVFLEFSKFGEIEEVHVCDNTGEHMIGNVFVKYASEEEAENCKDSITGKYYKNRLVVPEYSPVIDFRDGRCRQYETGYCKRGGNCNFLHLKPVPKDLKKALLREMYKRYPKYKDAKHEREREERGYRRRRDRSRSRSTERRSRRRRSRDRDRDRKRRKKDKKKRRRRSRSRGSRSGSRHSRGESARDIFKMTSAERRAMIASWGKEDEEVHPKSPKGDEAKQTLPETPPSNNDDERANLPALPPIPVQAM